MSHGIYHVPMQHEVVDVCRWNDDAMVTVKTTTPAEIEKSFDFFIDAANCLDLSQLIDRSSDGTA